MMAPPVVLHVGMQQSGAGLIQRGLARNRGQLQARHISYLGQADIEALPHVAGWLRAGDAESADVAPFERELAQAAYSSIRRHRPAAGSGRPRRSVVLLSSDHLLGQAIVGTADYPVFRPRAEVAVTQVLNSLHADRARIVLYTQRQDRLMELSYLRAIQSGRHHSFEEQFPYRYQPALDYSALVTRLRAIPRVSEVVVRPFELSLGDSAAFLDDFLGVVGLRGLLDVAGFTASPPRLYSAQARKLALALNPHLHTDSERLRVRRFLLANFASADVADHRFLDDAERSKIVDAHASVNRALFRSTMPDLAPDSYDNDERTGALRLALPAYSGPSLRRQVASTRDLVTLRIAAGACRRRLLRRT